MSDSLSEAAYARAVAFGLIRAADGALSHALSLLDAVDDAHRHALRPLAQGVTVLGDDLHEAIATRPVE